MAEAPFSSKKRRRGTGAGPIHGCNADAGSPAGGGGTELSPFFEWTSLPLRQIILSSLHLMNLRASLPVVSAAVALPLLLSSCVVDDGYGYSDSPGGYYEGSSYPRRYSSGYGGNYYGGNYGNYYGSGYGSSYNRRRYYDNHDHDHDHDHDRKHSSSSNKKYSSSSSSRSSDVRHGDHYHSSQTKKEQHQSMVRRGDDDDNRKSSSSSRSSSSKKKDDDDNKKGGIHGRERR